jgi:glycosyltransferase involved in cell wall biosynthesis
MYLSPNGGQGSAFNAGFSASRGDVVIFLDADDMLMPHCLDTLSQNWNKKLSKIHFNLLMIGKSGDSFGETFCKIALPRGDLKPALLKDGNYVSMPASGNGYSRSFLNMVMPMPETGWRRGADAYLNNLAALSGYVGAIDSPLGFYRVHDKNGSFHVIDSRFHFDKCYTSIIRERNTEEEISKYSHTHGLRYNTGALTNSYAHLQQLIVHDKLAPLFKRRRFGSPLNYFVKLSIAAFSLRNISAIKVILVHSWMFPVLSAPSKPRCW